MKDKSSLGLGIGISVAIVLTFAIYVVGVTFFDFYDYLDPYYFFLIMATLGFVLFTVGLAGRLAKGKHRHGYDVTLIVGIITLLATYLYYYLCSWWWW